MTVYQTLEVRSQGRIATVTLNRPEKRNALSRQLIAELEEALTAIERSAAEVVVLTGAGKAFCAGMDLEELKSMAAQSPEENLEDSRRTARLFRRLYEFPRPTIAAVNGAAIAGGLGLATMCDFTLAAAEAKLGYTETRIGFIPALVASILVWQVGHKTARDLLLTARLLDAGEAERLGLVNQVVPGGQVLERAHALAEQLLENSPSSLRATKQLLNRFLAEALDRGIELAVHENAGIRQTADFREGVASFLEKRKPRWSGR